MNARTQGSYIRMLDHTADIGFEISSPTLEARRALLMTVFG